MRIEIEKRCSCSPDCIYQAIRNGNELIKYWHGMRDIRPVAKDRFEVRFQFPGKSIMEYRCQDEDRKCTETYLSGPFRGVKTTHIRVDGNESIIESIWEIKLSPLLRIAERRLKEHFSSGTEHALERMCASVTVKNPAEDVK